MNMDLIAVLALGALAVAFLVRRYWRVSKGQAPVCGNCDNCSCDPCTLTRPAATSFPLFGHASPLV